MTPKATADTKKTLRAALRKERDAFVLRPEAKVIETALNAHLAAFLANAKALLAADAQGYEIASFLPLGSEFDFNQQATPQWLYPRVDGPQELVWFRRGASLERLSAGAFGVREAAREECFVCDASARKPWIVVVPALACDASHVRLGYGGGFYDRFLARHGVHMLTVCCLPARFLVPVLPSESFDVPVDVVIDEHAVRYRPQKKEMAFSSFASPAR